MHHHILLMECAPHAPSLPIGWNIFASNLQRLHESPMDTHKLTLLGLDECPSLYLCAHHSGHTQAHQIDI